MRFAGSYLINTRMRTMLSTTTEYYGESFYRLHVTNIRLQKSAIRWPFSYKPCHHHVLGSIVTGIVSALTVRVYAAYHLPHICSSIDYQIPQPCCPISTT